MNEADALVALRKRYSSWDIGLNQGMWQAKGRVLIRSSSLSLLQAAMDGEPPFPSHLAKERVRVETNGPSPASKPRPQTPCGTPEPGRGRWWRGALRGVRAVTRKRRGGGWVSPLRGV